MLSSTKIYPFHQTRKKKALHHLINNSLYSNLLECCCDGSAGPVCALLVHPQYKGHGYASVAYAERSTTTSMLLPNFAILKRSMSKNHLAVDQGPTQIKDLIKVLRALPLEIRKQRAKQRHHLTQINPYTNSTMLFSKALKNSFQVTTFQKEVTIKTQMIGGGGLNAFYPKVLDATTRPSPYVYQKIQFLIVVKGLINKLLKGNSRFIKQIGPYLYSNLKGSSTTAGFQKTLYNKISMKDRKLQPSTNRRKHNHSHYLIITNQFRRINKTFHYVGRQNFLNIVAFALKTAYVFESAKYICFISNSAPSASIRAIPYLVSTIETQILVLLWRNQFRCHLISSRHTLLHQNIEQGIRSLHLCPSQRPRGRNSAVVLLKK